MLRWGWWGARDDDHLQHLATAGAHDSTGGRKQSHHNNRSVTPKRRYFREPTAISEQTKSASLGSLIGRGGSGIGARRGVRIPHQGSVRQRYGHELSAVVAVPERMNDRLDFHAGRKGLGNPALPRQTGRAAHLHCPMLCLALGIV